jgi:phosphohistidine phosphatase
MKTIVLVRHSNAEDGNYQLKDYDRQLTPKGIKKAIKIAGMCASYYQPQSTFFYSSAAPRALQTAEIFAETLNYKKDQIASTEFLYYGFSPEELHANLMQYNQYDTIWLFGHNPMITDLYNYYTNREIESFPKCMVVAIQFEIDSFEQIQQNSGKAVFMLNPKVL